MARDRTGVVVDFRKFTADDFDDLNGATGPQRLYALCEEVLAMPDPTQVFPELFALMERLSDSDLGTPGPLVHTMETRIGSYERFLVESINRKPTDLSVWMVNRILNGPEENKAFWMDVLVIASEHPSATQLIKDQAKRFIELQKKK